MITSILPAALAKIGILLYVLSFGPACWLTKMDILPAKPVATVYEPLVDLALSRKRSWFGSVLSSYATTFCNDDRCNVVFILALELIPNDKLTDHVGHPHR